MADQDFQINIRTIADTTGIKLTQAQLEALQKSAAQGNRESIAALRQLASAQKEVSAASSSAGGFSGAAIGVGTIVTLLTGAINKWKQFNDEQDRIIDKMVEATAKMRSEALEVAEIKDLDFSQELIDQSKSTEELTANVDRLNNKIRVLKSEQRALDPLTQAKEWKALRAEIKAYESQLNSVTQAIKRKNEEEKKAEEKRKRDRAQLAREAGVPPGGSEYPTGTPLQPTEIQKLDRRLGLFAGLSQRRDLTPAEEAAAREEQGKATSDLRDAAIQAEKDRREQEAELTRQRYEGPGEGTLRRESYFYDGPGSRAASEAPQRLTDQKLDQILQFMKQVWGY